MIFLKKYWGLFIVILLSFWAVQPLLIDGFFPIHDDTQVVRVSQMAKALSDGHFPVRLVKDLGYGYGYPLFNFYAPLPYYVGGLFNIFGIDALISTKAMMVVGILLSGVFMYFLAREFWGEVGAVVSGLFYMYAPYHAVDIYVRGAVGEFWAYSFIPLAFYGLWKTYQKQRLRWVVVGAIGFAGVILSHNLTAMMIAPFLFISLLLYYYIAIKKRKLSIIYHLLSIILLGLGLSAFYWLPAFTELRFTNVLSQIGGGADFRDHFVCWQQLWESQWGFGGSAPGCMDGLSFKIGKLHILTAAAALLIAVVVILRKRFHSNDTYHHIVIMFLSLIGLIMSMLLTIEISRPLWEIIYPMAFIQYPWRFLVFVSFVSSFLAGTIVWWLSSYYITRSYYSKLVAPFILILLLLISYTKLFAPQTILPKTVNDYISEYNVKWITSKTSDEYMPKGFSRPTNSFEAAQRRVDTANVTKNTTDELVFVTNKSVGKSILIKLAPFPSWQATIDGISTSYESTNKGMEIFIPKGKHEIKFNFVSTQIEKLANLISLMSALGIIGGILLIRAGRMTRVSFLRKL